MYDTLQKEVQRSQARSQQVTEERDQALSQTTQFKATALDMKLQISQLKKDNS
jgi:hypothetical protein